MLIYVQFPLSNMILSKWLTFKKRPRLYVFTSVNTRFKKKKKVIHFIVGKSGEIVQDTFLDVSHMLSYAAYV